MLLYLPGKSAELFQLRRLVCRFFVSGAEISIKSLRLIGLQAPSLLLTGNNHPALNDLELTLVRASDKNTRNYL